MKRWCDSAGAGGKSGPVGGFRGRAFTRSLPAAAGYWCLRGELACGPWSCGWSRFAGKSSGEVVPASGIEPLTSGL